MKQRDKLFVTISVTDKSGKKIAVVKNAGYDSGMDKIAKIIDTKYRQQRTPPPPPLIMSMLFGDEKR